MNYVPLQVFLQRDYDCLDPDSNEFNVDLEHITGCFADMDQRLGRICFRALSECPTIDHMHKVQLLSVKSVNCGS